MWVINMSETNDDFNDKCYVFLTNLCGKFCQLQKLRALAESLLWNKSANFFSGPSITYKDDNFVKTHFCFKEKKKWHYEKGYSSTWNKMYLSDDILSSPIFWDGFILFQHHNTTSDMWNDHI